MTQPPAIVQHLQVLEASGLVRSEKVGRVRTCRIEPSARRGAASWLGERRSAWERRLDRLGGFLVEADPRRARGTVDLTRKKTRGTNS